MERRNLLKLFPWMLSVFGLGVVKGSQTQDALSVGTELENCKVLKHNEVFVLPSNPRLGETVIFVNENTDWEKHPPIIKSLTHVINGKMGEDLLVDLNASFGLRFLGRNAGWQYYKV
jgi:hypothetical protein